MFRHLAGEADLPVFWGGEDIPLSGSGFTQVNTGGGEILYTYVLAQAAHLEGVRVIDAYCGIGVLGRALARQGNEVMGIDIHPAPEGTEPMHGSFTVRQGRVEEELAGAMPAELVLLNPPRAGVDSAVSTLLVERPVPSVLYVSCDPGTLGRDLERMRAAYKVESVRSFDLFPQTEHVETVVSLERQAT